MAHALIYGASGISGWSLLNQTRIYPTPTTFSRITGTTSRPFSLEKAQIPQDERIKIASGIDLTKSADQVAAALKEKVEDISTVTHVFFTGTASLTSMSPSAYIFAAYIQEDDFETLKQTNTRLLENAVRAIEQLAPNLKSIILQTGGKGYGLEFPQEVGIADHIPLKESCPRIPEPYASKIFYYTQYDLLKQLSEGKSWTFSEVRPDGVVGFAPGTNAMNMAQGIAIYLAMYKEVHGAGATVPFPGHEHGYNSTHTDTFQDILSQMEIHAALNTDKCGNGGVFNVADGKVVTWAQVWPRLCERFGLVGGSPQSDATSMLQFVKNSRNAWVTLAKRHGLNENLVDEQGWGHTNFMLVDFDFDRQYDLSRSREVGFTESIDTAEGYFNAWERVQKAKMIPPFE
ncbi:hypothetical protein D6C90_02777 [Aureobasidium pullulans]|uniref:PRISE-like Rossmann-fold domain-containing protein n=1 Tax=Aureobasidium pullulans TaxID=5580 RepID=A0A4S9VE76_AURPU|nr:hypothetical protein D6C90_02777 [Aureobasidium pullulans]TIA85567.1 hypothetical protein D6C76_00897 [Aureobasidium pullulans]